MKCVKGVKGTKDKHMILLEGNEGTLEKRA